MGVYRLELASTGRSICKNKECKDNQIKIEKGSLRFCTQFDVRGNLSWAYKHWGCVTPAQIQNLKETIEDNLQYLDGYDELSPELQGKVERALKEGHVDDSDWCGDVEQNRPGSKGVRLSASKKKHMAENSEAESHGSPTPTKPVPKKRGRKKIEDAGDAGASAPPPKKPKPAPRRDKDDEAEDANTNTLPPKKARATSKKTKKAKDSDAEPELENEAPKVKKGRGKGKNAEAKQISDVVALKEGSHGDDAAPPSPTKKKQPTRKTAGLQKFKSAPEEEGTDSESKAFENEPKIQKARKKPNDPDSVVKTKKAAVRGRRTKDT